MYIMTSNIYIYINSIQTRVSINRLIQLDARCFTGNQNCQFKWSQIWTIHTHRLPPRIADLHIDSGILCIMWV